MIHIIDTYNQIPELFDHGTLHGSRWEHYINSIYPGLASVLRDEVAAYIHRGAYTFEHDFLPIINQVCKNPRLDMLHEAFLAVTGNLNQNLLEAFGKPVDADIALILGLCNFAGRATVIKGAHTILLGVEKILELGWHDLDSMYGLVYHELGHIYHSQHGLLNQQSRDSRKTFVWQLFTEGIAMYFEQALVGDFDFYHQNQAGWKEWCDCHFPQILADFHRDLPSMSRFNQRYFGDWCDYLGYHDTGYYLGCRFVHYLKDRFSFDRLIGLNIDLVYDLYEEFALPHQESKNSLST